MRKRLRKNLNSDDHFNRSFLLIAMTATVQTKKQEITAVNFPNQKTNKKDIIMNTSSAPTSDRQITDSPGINNRCKSASIAKTRWVAYAAAGAATALAGSQSAEAAIHYSGRVNELFLVRDADSFKLDRPGDFFRLSRTSYGYGQNDKFAIDGIASAAFRGFLDIFTNRH